MMWPARDSLRLIPRGARCLQWLGGGCFGIGDSECRMVAWCVIPLMVVVVDLRRMGRDLGIV